MTDQAHLCLDYIVDKILKASGVVVPTSPILMDILVAIALAAIVYPLCILKEFHRIRVILKLLL